MRCAKRLTDPGERSDDASVTGLFRKESHRRRRPLTFLIHNLLGLKLSLFTLFVCLTGTVAVVSDDLEWFLRSEVRADAVGPGVSWGAQYEAARVGFPRYTIDYAFAGEAPYLASQFLATDPAGSTRRIYVDPATGQVTGESAWVTLPAVVRALHYHLFVPGDWGLYAVTALGFLLLGSLITGLLLYKKFWRGFFRLPRRNRGARVLWGDLHRLVGLWSTWFVLIMAVTSLWYLAERALYSADIDFETPRQVIDAAILDALGPEPPKHLPLDVLIAKARAELPALVVKEIWFPAQPDEPIWIRGQATAWLVRNRTNGVELSPYTGEVLAVHSAEAMQLAERWSHTADPLHFGDFGGLVSKLIWAGFGLAMCFSTVSGAVVYVKRIVGTGRDLRRRSFAAASPALVNLRFLGRWKWPNLLAVTAVPVLACFLSWVPGLAPEASDEVSFGPTPVGSWYAAASTGTAWPPEAGQAVTWQVRLCDGCFGDVRIVKIGLAGPRQPPSELVPVTGNANNAVATVVAPGGPADTPLHLWLELTGWNGRRHLIAWQLPGRSI